MKRIAFQLTYPAPRAVAVAALLATFAVASPVRAASVDLAQAPAEVTVATHAIVAQATSTEAPVATKQTPSRATAAKAPAVDRVEARIKDLHAKLKITPAQEDLWTNVTEVMRDNAKRMDALTKARAEHAKTMTAVEDLTSYGEIAESHADGIKKFTPVFQTLYDSMSDAQKQNADTMFRGRARAAPKSTPSTSK